MKGAGETTDLLKNRQKLLEKEFETSGEKVSLLNSKLEKAKEVYGENSVEASNWSAKLSDAKREQEVIGQQLANTNAKLNQQKDAQIQLENSLSQSDGKLKQFDQELQLNAAKLEGASNKTELLKDRQVLLSNQYKVATDKTKTLQNALDECTREVGKNSDEYVELKAKLTDAQIQEESIKNAIKDTTKELEDQKTNLETFGDGLGKFGEGTERIGQSLKTVSATATGGLVGAATAAITFESAFAGVKKTTDEVYDANGNCVYSYQELEDGIRNMAKEIPASTSEIAAVAETAGQLGIRTEDILGFTRVMVDMGNSTDLASEEAATSIARFANITGLAADQTMSAEEKYGKIGSTIVDLGNKFATTEPEIMGMAQNLASAGSQIGMSESDILALATALSSVGMEAQAGGTAFSKVMTNMQLAVETGSDKLKDFADVAGMSADEFAAKFKEDATGALEAFIEGLSKCGGETDSAIKVLDDMGITETRMRDALLRSANASETFTSAIQTGKTAWEENSALTEEANKRYETTASQLKMMKNNIYDVGITLGSIFLPMISSAVEKVTGFADKIEGMSKNSQKALLGIVAFVAILSPLFIGIGKISTGISAVISVGSKLGGMFATTGAAAKVSGAAAATGMTLPLGPILAVVAAIGVLIGIFALLWNKSESFREYFIGMWEGLKDTVSGFLESIGIKEKTEEIKKTLEGMEEKLKGLEELFKAIGTIIGVVVVAALAIAAGGFNALINIINPLLTIIGGIIDVFSGLGKIIVGVFTGDLDLAKQGAELFKQGIAGIFGGLYGAISGALSGFLTGIVSFFGSLLSKCGLEGFISGAKTKFTNLKESALGVFESIKSGIVSKIDGAKDAVKKAIDKIKSFFNFEWSLPKLKLPKISITGGFSLAPPSAPKFDIKWNAKGAIFSKPTIFPTRLGFQGVGEAEPEAIAPITLLRSYVEDSVERAMQRVKGREETIDYDRLARSCTRMKVIMECDGREIARAREEVEFA